MKKNAVPVRFTDSEIHSILGALSCAIEEHAGLLENKRGRERLVRLHCRFLVMVSGRDYQPDYAVGSGGSIINARNPDQVFVPSWGLEIRNG